MKHREHYIQRLMARCIAPRSGNANANAPPSTAARTSSLHGAHTNMKPYEIYKNLICGQKNTNITRHLIEKARTIHGTSYKTPPRAPRRHHERERTTEYRGSYFLFAWRTSSISAASIILLARKLIVAAKQNCVRAVNKCLPYTVGTTKVLIRLMCFDHNTAFTSLNKCLP